MVNVPTRSAELGVRDKSNLIAKVPVFRKMYADAGFYSVTFVLACLPFVRNDLLSILKSSKV